MNKLWHAMKEEMQIPQCKRETDSEFISRLFLSALGLWCLNLAKNVGDDAKRVSKNGQSRFLEHLLNEYIKLEPETASYFLDQRDKVVQLIRRIYEETGYLITDEDNKNALSRFGRTASWGIGSFLYFGLPEKIYYMNGLGVYTSTNGENRSISEIFIRDDLSPTEYVQNFFNICEFEEQSTNNSDLQFFDPTLNNDAPSFSWTNQCSVEYTMARKDRNGPYYRTIQKENQNPLFIYEATDNHTDRLTSKDFRRLYYSLKNYYNHPSKARIEHIDLNYDYLKLPGFLPNREYYLLMLSGWPKKTYINQTEFIIRKNSTEGIKKMLTRLGIEIL